jgi:hypothetical protein
MQMRITDILHGIQAGLIKPEAEVSIELGFSPAKVVFKLKAGDISKLMLDTHAVSDVLRRCFVQRRILHERLEAEGRTECVKSAQEIIQELRSAQGDLPKIGANSALVSFLAQWEDLSVTVRQELEGNADTTESIRRYRAQVLPIVEALIAMLPTDHRTRLAAQEKVYVAESSLSGRDRVQISDAWRLIDS